MQALYDPTLDVQITPNKMSIPKVKTGTAIFEELAKHELHKVFVVSFEDIENILAISDVVNVSRLVAV